MEDRNQINSETKTDEVKESVLVEETESGSSDITQEEEELSFQEIFENSIKDIKQGEIVEGEVIQVIPDYVLVDVGYKSEGRIAASQFHDGQGQITVKVGDSVKVYLEQWEDENGEIVLSKEKADQLTVWEDISKVLEKDGVIEGRVSALIKGGLSVDIGIQAFLPGSQVDLHPIRDLGSLIGKTFKFKVLKFNKKRGNIVLSRRALLEKERESLRVETIKTLKEGEIIEGVIKNITDYGAFIDLGGLDGLLHITDISWGRVSNPSDMFKIGETIKVKILRFEKETERVSLGYKQTKPDPWEKAEEKFPVGARIKGKIVNITNYGAFIELEEGIEGLIHISEMSWVKKVKHPSQLVAIGDVVEAMVLDLDVPRKRVSLSLKQLEPNPWVIMEEKYPSGTVIEGKVKNITDFGIFIGFDEGIDGLVHISDISWTQKIKHPSELYKKGQEVRAVVLSIDKENERFSLGIKQMEKDPWEEISEQYKKGQNVTGSVTNITSFGLFLELGEGIEGLVHISELGDTKTENCKSGDQLSAVVTNVDKKGRKISLSIKELSEGIEKKEVEEYMEERDEPTSLLGEKLKEKLEEKKKLDEGTDEGGELSPEAVGVQGTEETGQELENENEQEQVVSVEVQEQEQVVSEEVQEHEQVASEEVQEQEEEQVASEEVSDDEKKGEE
jgi:small subunit ribosomal protein S1